MAFNYNERDARLQFSGAIRGVLRREFGEADGVDFVGEVVEDGLVDGGGGIGGVGDEGDSDAMAADKVAG